jgi:hypothetical protein
MNVQQLWETSYYVYRNWYLSDGTKHVQRFMPSTWEEMKWGIQRGVSGLLLWEGSVRLASPKAMGQFWRSDSDRCCLLWGYGAKSTFAGKPRQGATPY